MITKFDDAFLRIDANTDNERFDNAKLKAMRSRNDKWLTFWLIVGVCASVAATFYIWGVVLFRSMPVN